MKYNVPETIRMDELLPILDGISDAVFIDDARGICRWCNGPCEEMYKINLEDIEGRSREFDTYGIMPILSNKAIATPAGEFFCQILRIY